MCADCGYFRSRAKGGQCAIPRRSPELLTHAAALALCLLTFPAFAACPDLGPQADLNGARAFPPGDAWNRDVSRDPVDPDSALMIGRSSPTARLHPDFGAGYGLPYVVVSASQRRLPIRFTLYPAESDPGPYPVPL